MFHGFMQVDPDPTKLSGSTTLSVYMVYCFLLTGSGVLEGEVLVLELVSVDGLAAGPVVVSEVATLKK